MTRDPAAITNRIAARTQHLPRQIRATIANLHLATPDGYPAGGGDGPRGSDVSDPTFAAVNGRTRIGEPHAYGPTDAHEFMCWQLAIIDAALDLLDEIVFARWIAVRATEADRCSGKIDPSCRNLRSSDDAGEHHGLCVDCRPKACTRCGVRPKEARRSPVTGEACCEACYRREGRTIGALEAMT